MRPWHGGDVLARCDFPQVKDRDPLGHDGFVCYLSLLCNLSWGSQKLLLPYFVVGYGFALVQRGDDRRIGLLICGAIQ